jgi:DNA replication protein DnaC
VVKDFLDGKSAEKICESQPVQPNRVDHFSLLVSRQRWCTMKKSMLLEAYLKRLRPPAVGRHYQELARQAAQGSLLYGAFLLALVEIENPQRGENAHQKWLRRTQFPFIKSLDQFDLTALPSLNKALVLNLAQGGCLDEGENLILLGNSGTGKTPLATALGLMACKQGRKVRFFPLSTFRPRPKPVSGSHTWNGA